jgi:hypothetical protein
MYPAMVGSMSDTIFWNPVPGAMEGVVNVFGVTPDE